MKSYSVKPRLVSGNKVNNPLLEAELKNVIKDLGLPTNFDIDLRGYSKCYFGRYHIDTKKIVVYVLEEDMETYIPYKDILETVIHEAIHHYQYSKQDFIRFDGVMHNNEFKQMEQRYLSSMERYLN